MLWFWWIYGGLLAFIALATAIDLHFGLRQIPDLNDARWNVLPQPAPRITVVVPACNEEKEIEACLRSLVAQDYRDLEIIAVDDRSIDRTGEIMDRMAAESGGRVRVLHIAELPPDWIGKNHAMWRGGSLASGEWILFTDGDVSFRADTLRRALAFVTSVPTDHFVIFPTAVFRHAGERVMTANFRMGLAVARPWRTHDPKWPVPFGVGAFNMVRRAAYEQAGTFEALRLAVIDDIGLGGLMKRAGFVTRVAAGYGMVSLHWATGAMGIVRTLTKNSYAVLGFRWYLAVPGVLFMLAYHVGAFVFVFLAPGWTRMGFAVTLAGIFYFYVALRAFFDIPLWYFFLHPVGSVLGGFTVLRSMYVTIRDGGVTWRGTLYPMEVLRAAQTPPKANAGRA